MSAGGSRHEGEEKPRRESEMNEPAIALELHVDNMDQDRYYHLKLERNSCCERKDRVTKRRKDWVGGPEGSDADRSLSAKHWGCERSAAPERGGKAKPRGCSNATPRRAEPGGAEQRCTGSSCVGGMKKGKGSARRSGGSTSRDLGERRWIAARGRRETQERK